MEIHIQSGSPFSAWWIAAWHNIHEISIKFCDELRAVCSLNQLTPGLNTKHSYCVCRRRPTDPPTFTRSLSARNSLIPQLCTRRRIYYTRTHAKSMVLSEFYDFRLRGLLVKSRVFWASCEQKAPKAKENFIFQQKSVCLYHTALIKNNTKVFVWFRLEYTTIESNGTFKSEYREHVFAFFNLQGHICHFFCYQNLVFELMKHRNFKKSEVKAQIGLFIFRCENLLFSIKK